VSGMKKSANYANYELPRIHSRAFASIRGHSSCFFAAYRRHKKEVRDWQRGIFNRQVEKVEKVFGKGKTVYESFSSLILLL
jgi:hypothetical protein